MDFLENFKLYIIIYFKKPFYYFPTLYYHYRYRYKKFEKKFKSAYSYLSIYGPYILFVIIRDIVVFIYFFFIFI
jgi:hypothetical protein